MQRFDNDTLLFLQLPGTPVFPDDSAENIPYAAGCLLAYLRNNGLKNKAIIPDHLQINSMGDQEIIDFIVSKKPAWLLLSLYMWNIERSLYIASKIKEKIPECKIVVGGPEVLEDNRWVFEHECVDHFICGEGEESLFNLLSSKTDSQIIKVNSGVKKYFSPYLAGTIKPSKKQSALIEAQRGCPFKCTFCYYPKSRREIAKLTLEEISGILALAREAGCSEIIFIDPTFNNYTDFCELLDLLVKENSDGFFKYNAEIKPHLLSDAEIERINKAGFRSLEVGLQTINKPTQEKIKCVVPPELFTKKVNLLNKDMELRIDLIVGLPGEDLKDIKKSIKYLKENHPNADCYLYHLSVLPGTIIRKQTSSRFYQKRPPYFITDNGRINFKEMCKSHKYFAELFGEEFDAMPDPQEICKIRKKINYTLFTRKNISKGVSLINGIANYNVLEFRSETPDDKYVGLMIEIVKNVTTDNPYSTFNIIVSIPDIDESALTERIFDSCGLFFDQYVNRSRVCNEIKIANLQTFIHTAAIPYKF